MSLVKIGLRFFVYFIKAGWGMEEELPDAVSAIPTCHRGQEFV
jgi:hypothetical protein